MSETNQIHSAVTNLYNAYPFPPEPLLDEPPPGYNWRWSWTAAYDFCTGRKPAQQDIRILDAGCGTGVGTEYLVHLNPEASVIGIDISPEALKVAQERCQRSGGADRVTFQEMNVEQAHTLEGQFEMINCVGVLHHLPDPVAGIKALASKLAPGGIMHIFVYGELGRWEVRLMQNAIALLQPNDYQEGVNIGRKLFEILPENNRIVKREKERWALDNQRDACFADMYVHPQEIDYNINTLFDLIKESWLDFVGFSNPQFWQLERLLGDDPKILERAKQLSEREQYRLIESLDPEVTHYEFFLSKPPLIHCDWSDDSEFLSAIPERHPCMEGWESRNLFNADYELVSLSEEEFNLLKAINENREKQHSLREIITEVGGNVSEARSLHKQKLITLTPVNSQ
ncbi:class I SAM-dependent methyltransferase [Euhalothece natronophila Z-M001]|uniref:Class I SAM-dependent methyltransferase n=1 Tax=Euhalothece natronophila Z-M001 TaxID=522448 RepID=A0A5B8NLT5_9CHRO|nr:class I SAM-dependent methyltransferase [Euhalothece natronophila]QDZ39230.1 class I SAM-dependent methyltransferase [Euhalothece natronophila Z-M001]